MTARAQIVARYDLAASVRAAARDLSHVRARAHAGRQ
jgi:hypothetical protein